MTDALLDTNVALLGLASPERLSRSIRRTVESGRVYLSVISYWEVVLKSGKGKLDVGNPHAWWVETLEKLAATQLPFRSDHVSKLTQLAPIHGDPFDRALIAQATVERFVLVTTDHVIERYASKRLRVVT